MISSKWQSFNDIVDDHVTGIGYEFNNIEDLKQKLLDIENCKVLEEYRKVFSDYYSEEYHRQNIKNKLEEYFNVFEQEKNK